MNNNLFDFLKERGFIAMVSDEDAIRKMLEGKPITFYIGFDSSSTSLHAGSLIPIMAMMHLQRAGHHPIAIIGGGTTMLGDPSGRTEMRKMLDEDTILANGRKIQAQLDRYLHFDGKNSITLNNIDWLLPLSYVAFLRDIGKHFSVNRMLAAEAYKLRLEKGLSFIEFNYQLLQAYDYLTLSQKYACTLQMGGDDQWGNILAGVDLIRRKEGVKVEAMTFPLLTTASGAKMGKTAGGAVWLDADLLNPYDFFQYWINCDDQDVKRFLRLFTFLPIEDIKKLESLEGSDIRKAKQVLAYEATSITHGKQAAEEALKTASTVFGTGGEEGKRDLEAMPTTIISHERLAAGIRSIELFCEVRLTSSRGDAKRLIKQGGLYVNEKRIENLDRLLNEDDLTSSGILLRAGKKKYHRLVAE